MDEMTATEWEAVSEAVVVWIGRGVSNYPDESEARVVDKFGAPAAAKLMPLVRRLADEFYSSNARFVAKNLAEMYEMAAEQFLEKFPMIARRAAEALAWSYTWDFK